MVNESSNYNNYYSTHQTTEQARLRQAGLENGSNPQKDVPIIASTRIEANEQYDWRVGLDVPGFLKSSPLIAPLGDRLVFPFTPTIILGHSASYSQVQPTHTNYPYYAYQNSQVDVITINGDFFSENESDALHWVATIHFLRTMTKMFYGEGQNAGKPPPMTRLNGYGKHVMNNIPVVITNFTTDLPADVDYISCNVGGQDGETNYVPSQSTITVQVAPTYARRSVAKFDLQKYANGGFIGGSEGFV